MAKPGLKPLSAVERILRKTVYEHGCWLFTGARNKAGHGKIRPSEFTTATVVHRIMFEEDNGPIADSMQLKHLCRNMMCCNPLHLQLVPAGQEKRDVVERILAKTVYDHGCWLFTGAKNENGYGVVNPSQKDSSRLTHRVMYQAVNGPIPKDQDLDHLCRNTMCCNPIHLQAVTHAENVRRSISGVVRRQRAKAQAHCKRGHELAGSNLGIGSSGSRYCKACHSKSVMDRNRRIHEQAKNAKVDNTVDR